ncbi:MAG: PASTA domain-containing protein, partial [Ruminococcus sp.]|nr:PASTA domain-containing protein [Ruminococcus sp.]
IYEPGSVFKVITSASAIEEDLINLATDSFYCSGSVKLDGAFDVIRCDNTSGHGSQSFQQALTNSCNPAFMEIGARLGVKKFCYYFDAFGLSEKTGIDLPAESVGLGFDPDEMTNVDLAVSAFGQGETITPMEMITSYCAAINGGYLLKPYVVDKIVDEDGNVVLKNERTVRRQVVSEETSAKMRNALYHVVADNNGGNVSIKGYSIGGKSGTSQRLSVTSTGQVIQGQEDASAQEYGASYVCFTPADDPEIILLVLADMPNKDIGYYGSVVAVPTARDILTDVLPYLGYSPQYTDEELDNLDVKIPLLEGPIDDAKATLKDLGVECKVIGSGIEVVAQSPVTGSAIAKGGTVYLYTEKGHTVEYEEVPDLVGVSPSFASEQLAYCDLNFVAKGASITRENAVVSSQSIAPYTKVPKGTVIELELMVYSYGD